MREIHNKNNSIKSIYVDIDETICFFVNDRIYEDAIPNYDNINKINILYDSGCKITYWTSRGSSQPANMERLQYLLELTISQLQTWKAKYHHLELNKPFYDLIIDDKAKRIEEL